MTTTTYEVTSPLTVWTEGKAEVFQPTLSVVTKILKPANDIVPPTPVILLLAEGQRAIDIFNEAAKAGNSNHPLVRAVIDEKLGFINIAKERPQDEIEERLLVVRPRNGMWGAWAKKVVRIAFLPGVVRSATSISEFAL